MAEMIESPESYFTDLRPAVSTQIKRLEAEALVEGIPIVGPVMAQMLYVLARATRSTRILEFGSAIGYSTIFLAAACKINNGILLTYENNTALAERARANLAEAGLQAYAEVRCTDAILDVATLNGSMDMIFLDIEKADYLSLLPWCKSLLSNHGLLVADNTGFTEAASFNHAIHNDPEWQSVNLWSFLPGHSPNHDGFCLAVKTPSEINRNTNDRSV